MVSIQLLATAWTVWTTATKRVGPVGGLLVTAVVIGGFVYFKPWLTENVPRLAQVLGVTQPAEDQLPDGGW